MLEDVLYVLLGAGVAILGGFGAQHVHTQKWMKKDIKKTKSLLRSELNDIYRGLNFEKQHFEEQLKKLQHEHNTSYERNIVINDAIAGCDVRLQFLSWETIISSGALFKLNNRDIKIIQTAQQNIRSHDENMEILRKQLAVDFRNYLSVDLTHLESRNNDLLKNYFKDCRDMVNRILLEFEDLDKLTWFDHTKIPEKKSECIVKTYSNTPPHVKTSGHSQALIPSDF